MPTNARTRQTRTMMRAGLAACIGSAPLFACQPGQQGSLTVRGLGWEAQYELGWCASSRELVLAPSGLLPARATPLPAAGQISLDAPSQPEQAP